MEKLKEEWVSMKKNIHPELKEVTVKCACGAEHKFLSSETNIKIDLCSQCHPFYKGDGSSLLLDSEGRVQKFRNKYGDKY